MKMNDAPNSKLPMYMEPDAEREKYMREIGSMLEYLIDLVLTPHQQEQLELVRAQGTAPHVPRSETHEATFWDVVTARWRRG